MWLANEISLPVHHRVRNRPEPDQKVVVGSLPLTALQRAGGCLNKKDGLTRYGNSHVKDKTS